MTKLERKHHQVHYSGKTVTIDYVTDPKREWSIACMRVQDDAGEGYVLTPKGEVFQLVKGSRSARRVADTAGVLPLFAVPA